MDLKTFRDLGLLQELNRRVLHPAGFALSLETRRVPDLESELKGALKTILVATLHQGEGPEGFKWAGLPPGAAEKAASFLALQYERRHDRERALGAAVQPIPGFDDGEPASLASDDRTVDLCVTLASEAFDHYESAGEDDDLPDPERDRHDFVEAVLLRVLGPLVASLRVYPGGNLRAPPPTSQPARTSPPGEEPKLNRAQLARARWLSRELPRIAGTHEVSGGRGSDGGFVRRTADTELMPAEAEEARALAKEVTAWPLTDSPPGAAKVLSRMEDLFALGQAGMRFWRGQRPDLTAAADIIQARLDAYRATRTELDRFLAGELAAHELTDRDGIRAALEDRAAPLREELEAIDAERASAATALEPVTRALSLLSVSRTSTAPGSGCVFCAAPPAVLPCHVCGRKEAGEPPPGSPSAWGHE